MVAVRSRAASRAAAVRKVAPVSWAKSSGIRLPTSRAGGPSGFGRIGWVPIGYPWASRHAAWW